MDRKQIEGKYDEFFGTGYWEVQYKQHIVEFAFQCSNDGKPMLAAVLGDERYEAELATYLNDGIDYNANTIGKADQGDLEQLAADSFFAGYKAAVERLTNGG